MSLRTRLLGVGLAFTRAFWAQEVHAVGDIFKPLASPAESVYHLSVLTIIVCAAIFFVVAGLAAYAVVRFRDKGGEHRSEPPQVYGSNQIEIAWTVIPILIVFVLTMSIARVTSALQDQRMPADATKVTVVGHQWWWEYRYPDLGIVTANEMHVPLSTRERPKITSLTLESADVAHSFWIPQLAGKTDVIPNRVNHMWVDPREPGVYLGNCAEYCGTQHANMLVRVVVDSPEDFEKWVAHQKEDAAHPNAQTGRELFLSLSCVNCHAVKGTPADGKFGPDLSHIMSRQTIASGMIPNNLDNLLRWVKDPQEVKPGNLMPNMQLNETESNLIVAYLSTLK
jgi:cytochrome c oxidase subunit II